MTRLCRECKQQLPPDGAKHPRQYCDNDLCGQMHAQRASKARRGRASVRPCKIKAEMLTQCESCPIDCEICHNTHTARLCPLGRRVRWHNTYRQRLIVPVDCKECAHGQSM
jgi:hypothetical protein